MRRTGLAIARDGYPEPVADAEGSAVINDSRPLRRSRIKVTAGVLALVALACGLPFRGTFGPDFEDRAYDFADYRVRVVEARGTVCAELSRESPHNPPFRKWFRVGTDCEWPAVTPDSWPAGGRTHQIGPVRARRRTDHRAGPRPPDRPVRPGEYEIEVVTLPGTAQPMLFGLLPAGAARAEIVPDRTGAAIPIGGGCSRGDHGHGEDPASLCVPFTMSRPHTAAYRHLAADPVLRRIIGRAGEPDPFDWSERGFPSSSSFEAMAVHIVAQQISTAAAVTIFGRVAAAAGGVVSPAGLLALTADELRACGLSRAKVAYLHDLARRQADGRIDLDRMDDLDDATALRDLTAVHGVGRWSAEMFLIHQLRRPDVFPSGDIGLRHAIQRAWRLPETPGIVAADRRALPWSPYRTYAAALLWVSLRIPV